MKIYELHKGDHFVLADDPQKTPKAHGIGGGE